MSIDFNGLSWQQVPVIDIVSVYYFRGTILLMNKEEPSVVDDIV